MGVMCILPTALAGEAAGTLVILEQSNGSNICGFAVVQRIMGGQFNFVRSKHAALADNHTDLC